MNNIYKLVFFVPESHLDLVKSAVFAAGAGRIGSYDLCCWQTLGEGQFRPLAAAAPFIGELDRLSTVAEYRVEMVCADECVEQSVAALKAAHPYEMPGFDLWRLSEY